MRCSQVTSYIYTLLHLYLQDLASPTYLAADKTLAQFTATDHELPGENDRLGWVWVPFRLLFSTIDCATFVCLPLAAEALACVEGASLALRRGVHKLEIETDCQVLVKLWESRTSQRSEISPILSRLEDICRDFRDVRLSFVPRTYNQVAHICAQLASADNPLVEWLSPPMELQSHLHVPCNLDSHE